MTNNEDVVSAFLCNLLKRIIAWLSNLYVTLVMPIYDGLAEV